MNEANTTMNETRQNILNEVAAERERQIDKGFDSQHDDWKGGSLEDVIREFVTHIHDWSSWARARACMGSIDKARRRLVQVAALAVAAVEVIDRNSEADAELSEPVPDPQSCTGTAGYDDGGEAPTSPA